jgi:hypothetical protein
MIFPHVDPQYVHSPYGVDVTGCLEGFAVRVGGAQVETFRTMDEAGAARAAGQEAMAALSAIFAVANGRAQ